MAQPEPEPIQVAVATVPDPIPMPEEVPSPVAPVAFSSPANPIDLSADLEKAGLKLVETTSNTAYVATPSMPAQPLGRKPKPATVINSEPLQMVETQRKE